MRAILVKNRKANERIVNPEARLITWPVKLSAAEAMALKKNILYFASGKRSLYIRAALLNYKPKKDDFS